MHLQPTRVKLLTDKRATAERVLSDDEVAVAKDAVLRAFEKATKKMPVNVFKVFALELSEMFKTSAEMAGVTQ